MHLPTNMNPATRIRFAVWIVICLATASISTELPEEYDIEESSDGDDLVSCLADLIEQESNIGRSGILSNLTDVVFNGYMREAQSELRDLNKDSQVLNTIPTEIDQIVQDYGTVRLRLIMPCRNVRWFLLKLDLSTVSINVDLATNDHEVLFEDQTVEYRVPEYNEIYDEQLPKDCSITLNRPINGSLSVLDLYSVRIVIQNKFVDDPISAWMKMPHLFGNSVEICFLTNEPILMTLVFYKRSPDIMVDTERAVYYYSKY